MSTSPTWTVNNPSAGTEYIAPQAYWVVPAAGSSVTVTTQTFDGNGNLITVSSMTAICRNISAGTDAGSFTYSGGNTVNSTSSNGTNGSNVFAPAGKINSGSPAQLRMYITYTGSVYDQPPNAPANLSPSGLITTLTPMMYATFSDPTSGDTLAQHRVQVTNAANGGGTYIEDSGNQPATASETSAAAMSTPYGGSALSYGSQYSWRCQFANQNGNWGPWSGWVNFNTVSGPNTPTITAPSGPQTTLTPAWSFGYSSPTAVAMASYRLVVEAEPQDTWIYDSGWVTHSAASGTTITGNVPSAAGLQYGGSYAINFMVQDTNGAQSSWSKLFFSVAALPQVAPSSPVAGATVTTQTPTFTWTYTDANYPQGQAQVEIQNATTGVDILLTGWMSQSATSYTSTTSIAYGTQIRWRVQVQDTAGLGSGWSAWASAYVNNAPSATITAPTSGGTVATITPTITWTYTASSGGQAEASAQVLLNDANGNPLATYSVSGAGTSYTLPSGTLINGVTYQVQVKVTDTNSVTGQSAAVTFTVSLTPPADMQGQSLPTAHNYLQNTLLNKDSNNDGVADGWSILPTPTGMTMTPYIDLSVQQPANMANGDGPIMGTQAITLTATAGAAASEPYISQDVVVSPAGIIPGSTVMSFTVKALLQIHAGTPGINLVVQYYNGYTYLSQTYGAFYGTDTAGQFQTYSLTNCQVPINTTRVNVQMRVHANGTDPTPGSITVWWLEPQVEVALNGLTDPNLSTDGGSGTASGWSLGAFAGVTTAATIDTTKSNPITNTSGVQKLVISADTAAAGALISDVNQQVSLASMNLAVGQTVNAGAYAILTKNVGTPKVNVSVDFLDVNKAILSTSYGATFQTDTAGAWTFIAGPQGVTIPANCFYLQLNLETFNTASGDTGTVWWSSACLNAATKSPDANFVEGSLGTGYSYDANGFSLRTHLAGGVPTVLAAPGADSDPVNAYGGSIVFSWDTTLADSRFTGYLIERRRQDQSNDDTAWVTLATLTNASQRSYTDYSAASQTSYQYAVRQQIVYASGGVGVSQHRAIAMGSVNFSPAWYLTNAGQAGAPVYNMRLRYVQARRQFAWKERANYSAFLGRVGAARDAGQPAGYTHTLVCYFTELRGDSRQAIRRQLITMQRLGGVWYLKDPSGLSVPVFVQDITFDDAASYSETMLTATLSLLQALDTGDY